MKLKKLIPALVLTALLSLFCYLYLNGTESITLDMLSTTDVEYIDDQNSSLSDVAVIGWFINTLELLATLRD